MPRLATGIPHGALCLLVLCATMVFAGDDPPEKPWRPFPEMPAVLFFEGFEGTATGASKGAVSEDQANPPGKKAYKLGPHDKSVIMQISFGKARFPNGANPNTIFLQFMAWSDEVASINAKFFANKGVDYSDKVPVPKAKTWTPVLVKLADARNKNVHALPEHLVGACEITAAPARAGGPVPTVYIDDIIVTVDVKPEMFMGKIAVKQGKAAEMSRSPAKDGFSFSEQAADTLKATLKAAGKKRKLKEVLVFGDRGNSAEIIKALQAAAPKAKATGFNFVASTTPDGTPVAGLDDLRMLLPYNIEKANAEFVVLTFSAADAAKAGRSYEPARVCLDRALEMGCTPIVCMPPAGGKGDPFLGGVARVSGEMGLAWVDTSAVLKPVAAGGLDGGEVSAAGIEALAATIVTALKHVDANIRK